MKTGRVGGRAGRGGGEAKGKMREGKRKRWHERGRGGECEREGLKWASVNIEVLNV